jgi:hypothetical protein
MLKKGASASPGQECLAGTGRAHQQNAAGRADSGASCYSIFIFRSSLDIGAREVPRFACSLIYLTLIEPNAFDEGNFALAGGGENLPLAEALSRQSQTFAEAGAVIRKASS